MCNFSGLKFTIEFGELDAMDAEQRGYCSSAYVETEDGSRIPIFFFSILRLGQELASEVRQGTPFVAEPGMIVLTEVTLENMKIAVSYLWEQGYFSRFKPIGGEKP